MGAQTLQIQTPKERKQFFEDKMIKEGRDYLLYKHYHLGEPTDFKRLSHIRNLFRAYSSTDCNVQSFIEKQFELDHNYTNVDSSRRCEEFDICYNS